MPFLQLTLTIGDADPAPYEDALLAAGANSITLQDAADDPVLEPPPGATPLWPHVQIRALFDGSASPDDVLAILRANWRRRSRRRVLKRLRIAPGSVNGSRTFVR